MTQPALAVGLMSGTSRDGVDAALIRSDGAAQVEPLAFLSLPYDSAFRSELTAAILRETGVAAVERTLTQRHAQAVQALLAQANVRSETVQVVGFHGHTLLHDPDHGQTRQIGDGALLAALTGINVVADFRSADVAAGGQGAPLAPLYHRARAAGMERPLAVLNLGGVGNVTWLGPDDEILAFDTGPGNALIDDLMLSRTGTACDRDGAHARVGTVDEAVLEAALKLAYFDQEPPKSLDRDAFDIVQQVAALGTEDAAATLTAFTVASVRRALEHLPQAPKRWLVTGGGRHNPVLMDGLRDSLGVPVDPVEQVGWNGDALEAEAFAYLALRALDGRPLSLPATTGVPEALSGGRLFRAPGPLARSG